MGLVIALLPEFVLTAWTLFLILVIAWRHRDAADQQIAGMVAVIGLLSTLFVVLWFWVQDIQVQGFSMVTVDEFRFATAAVFLIGALLAVLISLGYLTRERIVVPEYYVLIMLATIGMMFMSAGVDLIVIFIGLELMSVCVYVLAGLNRRSVFAAEAALKYFLLGAFASAFLLYGIALIYGATGTTNLSFMYLQIAGLGLEDDVMLRIGIGLLLIGFAFKVAAVPFHMWAPDVYDGAPTPVTAFMAAAVKAAAFAALIRVLLSALGPSIVTWSEIVWWLAAVTMVVGNVVALAQRRIKRMLAYSSIGHAGYLLVAVASGTEVGAAAYLFYILAYTLMTMGAFAVLMSVGRDGERDVLTDDLAGLARQRPWVAFSMAVFMLALLGFPGTAGFIGKWYILSAAVDAGQLTLAIVLVLASVVSAGYYLPIIMSMYMKPAVSDTAHERVSMVGATRWVVGAVAIALLMFGVWPQPMLDVAEKGVAELRPSVMLAATD
jgi:NADH-quinone oxidoreductase subunit N